MKIILFFSLFLGILVFLSLFGFYTSIKPYRIYSDITPTDLGLAFETINIKTDDGINLESWFIPNQKNPNAKTMILLHGYPADKGNILPLMSFLADHYHLFFVDFRYFGKSEGKFTTLGHLESQDIQLIVNYLKNRNHNEIGIWGFSMGGAVAIIAGSKIPEIKTIISDSSFSNLELMTYEKYQTPLLKYPLGHLTQLWSKLFLKLDPKDVSPIKSLKLHSKPTLIIHSKNDDVIKFNHAQLFQKEFKNHSNINFWFTDTANHGQQPTDYEKIILEFLNKNL